MSAWLFTIPALVVNATGFSPTPVFKIFTLAICAAAYFFTLKMLERVTPEHAWRAVAIVLGVALFIMPGYHFGQREHLAAALVLPYVAMAMLRERGAATGTLPVAIVGVAAATGICIKPYFLALPLAVEGWLLVRTRRPALLFRVETCVMMAFGVAYLAAVAIWAVDYYRRVIPDALSNYSGLDSDWTEVLLLTFQMLAPLFFALILTLLAWGRGGRVPPSAAMALAAASGFLAAALLQKKGWYYQYYPVFVFLMLAIVLIYAHRDRLGAKNTPTAWIVAAFLGWVGIAGCAGFALNGYTSDGITARVGTLEQVFRKYARAEDRVFAFITSPRDIHPAVLQSGRRWAGTSGAMLYLPAELNNAYRDNANPAIARVAQRERDELLADLTRQPPAVIAVEAQPRKLGIADPTFDYIAYFTQFPQFAELWQGYAEIPRIAQFRIFVRRDAQAMVATQPVVIAR